MLKLALWRSLSKSTNIHETYVQYTFPVKSANKIKNNRNNNKDEKWQKWLDSLNLLLQLRNYAEKTLSNFHFKTY